MAGRSSMGTKAKSKAAPPTPLEWVAWYSAVEEKTGVFWAAWWTAEPHGDPWRSPDATGTVRPSADPNAPRDLRMFAEADAEGAIRKVKGPVYARKVEGGFAAAARRECDGERPNYKQPSAAQPGPSPQISAAPHAWNDAWKIRAYWRGHDARIASGDRPLNAHQYKLERRPRRPKDLPEPPDVRAEIAAKYPKRRAKGYWTDYIRSWTFGNAAPDPHAYGFDIEPEPIDDYTRSLAAFIRSERVWRARRAEEPKARARASSEPAWASTGLPSAAFSFLSVRHDATRADVRKAFAERALKNHPDHGGDGDMGELVAAKDAAIAYIERRDAGTAPS